MNLPLWLLELLQDLREAVGLCSPHLYQGVDISEFNGDIDFQRLKGKIDFAILRCGYGNDLTYQDDQNFQKNVKGCIEAGIPYGVYLYMYARDLSAVRSEAAHAIRLIKGTDPDFGVWYDVEDKSLAYGPELAGLCKAWCDLVMDAGITCAGVYASLSVMNDWLDREELDPYEKWVAQWNSICQYSNPGLWQYSNRGTIDGKVFDMDYAYRDYPDITGGNMTKEKFQEMMEGYLADLDKKPADNWAEDRWKKACDKGLFDGTGPRSALTREQAAILLDRLGEL